MAVTHDGGGGVTAAAQEIQLTIDAIKDIANRVMAELHENAAERGQAMSSVQIRPGSFGETDIAQKVGNTAAAAHEVFQGTVRGIVTVLEQYQQNLIATVNTYTAADDANAADISRLTPQALIEHYQQLNAQTIGQEGGRHTDVEASEQESFDEASAEYDIAPGGDERTSAGQRPADGHGPADGEQPQGPAPTGDGSTGDGSTGDGATGDGATGGEFDHR